MAEKGKEVITYDNYLKVPDLLRCQIPKSEAEIEQLFILVHQVFELWFKQVISDLDSIRGKLQEEVTGKGLFTMNKQMERVNMIFKLVVQQFAILETMSPMEFMDFRGYLSPASGFQSLQFRLIEIKLGVKDEKRIKYDGHPYTDSFSEEQRQKMQQVLKEPTLLAALEGWLENTPGLDDPDMNFVGKFKEQVIVYLEASGKKYEESGFDRILEEDKYEEDKEKGQRRLSRRAFLGALMIFLYREEPAFNQRCTLLQRLMDFENIIWQWRTNHVMMVHRMIGRKTGTGGSSGVGYLQQTVCSEEYRVFVDLFNVSTYLVPSKNVPELTDDLKKSLAFAADN